MQMKATRTIKDSKITTTLTIEAYGSATMSAEEEQEVLNDYQIEVDYGKIVFANYVKLDNHKNPVLVEEGSNDSANADEVILQMPLEVYKITDDMELIFAVDITKLEAIAKTFDHIQDPICLGKAMVLVYENAVINYIKERIEVSRRHRDAFESEQYYTI